MKMDEVANNNSEVHELCVILPILELNYSHICLIEATETGKKVLRTNSESSRAYYVAVL